MKIDDVIKKFVDRFQAKETAKANEYLIMKTTHRIQILTPVRKGERTVCWYLEV